jgi:cytochrome b6-f complex iron-sulfur subunit
LSKQVENTSAHTATKSRRGFIGKLWMAIGGLVLLEYAWMFVEFLRPGKSHGEDKRSATAFVAGPVDRFEPESVTAFPEGRFYLARLSDGGFLALHRECTHLGCTVPWDVERGEFVCPCHASSYDITGDVLSPPAPRALDLFAVRIENGIVKVDTSQRIKRSSFEHSQIARA